MKSFSGVEAWLVVSFLAMVLYVSGDLGTFCRRENNSLKLGREYYDQRSGMEWSSIGSLFSLVFIFVVGVSTGLLWKVTQKVSKEIVVLPEPPSPSALIASNSSPRTSQRTSSVGAIREYTLQEIQVMTGNFERELGQGGQGVVYLAKALPGENPPERALAVKHLQKGTNVLALHNLENRSQEVMEKEFWAELNTFSQLHHRNISALFGLERVFFQESAVV